MSYEPEKQVAIAAVTAAARLCEQVRQERGSTAMEKSDHSPVTVADFGAQAVICQALAEAFPDDPVVGEEDSTLLRTPAMAPQFERVTHYVGQQVAGATPEAIADWIDWGNGETGDRYWTLDPIDGTKGYVRGDQYAIALALIEAGQLQLGILGCPALPHRLAQPETGQGVIFAAVRGQGTMAIPLAGGEPELVRTTQLDTVGTPRLIESVESRHGNIPLQEAVAQAVGLTPPPLRIDSQAKYGVVARGEAPLYIRIPLTSDKRENIWDHAAGAIVVEEAGGRVSDIDGRPLDFSCGVKLANNRGIVASNGAIHDAAIAALAEMVKV
jgi:3'(2'), 5'-bisphosphate nucleotidase